VEKTKLGGSNLQKGHFGIEEIALLEEKVDAFSVKRWFKKLI